MSATASSQSEETTPHGGIINTIGFSGAGKLTHINLPKQLSPADRVSALETGLGDNSLIKTRYRSFKNVRFRPNATSAWARTSSPACPRQWRAVRLAPDLISAGDPSCLQRRQTRFGLRFSPFLFLAHGTLLVLSELGSLCLSRQRGGNPVGLIEINLANVDRRLERSAGPAAASFLHPSEGGMLPVHGGSYFGLS